MPTQAIALGVRTDAAHGGRWTSLYGGGREWLWHRDEPRRQHVVAGDDFADAGGIEECLPTVRGLPDHGEVWTRAWSTATGVRGQEQAVRGQNFELLRRLSVQAGAVVADYRLAADPGYRFVWAAHALLDLSTGARLEADRGTTARLFPEAAPYLRQSWPATADWLDGNWPAPAGLRLDALGPDDGTAVGAVLFRPGAHQASVTVHDEPDRLRLTVEAEAQPVSVALWRNLGGFPQHHPYRSIGVEPMLGRVFDLAEARAGDYAVTPATGEVHWRLTITARRRSGRN